METGKNSAPTLKTRKSQRDYKILIFPELSWDHRITMEKLEAEHGGRLCRCHVSLMLNSLMRSECGCMRVRVHNPWEHKHRDHTNKRLFSTVLPQVLPAQTTGRRSSASSAAEAWGSASPAGGRAESSPAPSSSLAEQSLSHLVAGNKLQRPTAIGGLVEGKTLGEGKIVS